MTDNRRALAKWIVSALAGVVALALVFYVYRGLDFALFWQGLRSAKPGWVAVLAATILLEQYLSGWKWRQILFDLKPISSLRLTGAMLAGYGANALVPLGISPLVRSWIVARLEGLKKTNEQAHSRAAATAAPQHPPQWRVQG